MFCSIYRILYKESFLVLTNIGISVQAVHKDQLFLHMQMI